MKWWGDSSNGGLYSNTNSFFPVILAQVQGLEVDLVRERDSLEKTRATLMEKNTKLEQDLEVRLKNKGKEIGRNLENIRKWIICDCKEREEISLMREDSH